MGGPTGATGGGGAHPPLAPLKGVDTKVLGKPINFDGSNDRWPVWSVVLRAYCGVLAPAYTTWMQHAEAQTTPALNLTLAAEGSAVSRQLAVIT